MVNEASVAVQTRTIAGPSGPRVPETGKVYFWGHPERRIKIGATVRISNRHRELRSTTGVPGKMLATVEGGNDLEQAYHIRFAEHRLHGEWFAPHPDLLAEIERLSHRKDDA